MNSAQVFLFKKTHTNERPDVPQGNLTYSFSIGFLAGDLQGWEQSIPVSGGEYKWVISAVAASESPSVVIPISAWKAAALLAEDGLSRYTATVYKQSVLDPGSPPAADSSYDFMTGILVPPTGWLATQPDTTTINTWAAEYTFVGFENETVIGVNYFGQTKVVAVAGIDGQNVHVITIYKQTDADITTPTGGSYKFDGDIFVAPLGWSRTMPTVNITPTYMSSCRFNSNDPMQVITAPSWSYPVVIARVNPEYVNRFKSVCFKYSAGMPGTPVGGSFDNPVPAGWSDGIPEYEFGKDIWMSSRMFYADDNNLQPWSIPTQINNANTSVHLQFSVDGFNWHDTAEETDIYMRSGTFNGEEWVYAGAVKIKGESGNTGTTGSVGPALYTWIAYAYDLAGLIGFTTGSPTNLHKYIGIARNQTNPIESMNPSAYTWSKWVGDAGAPGMTTFTWYAYADSADGTLNFTTGAWNNHKYLGLAFNKFVPTESTNPADYSWAAIGIETPSTISIIVYRQHVSPGVPDGGTYDFSTGVLTEPVNWVRNQPNLSLTPTYASVGLFTGYPTDTASPVISWGPVYQDSVLSADGEYRDLLQLYSITNQSAPSTVYYTFSTNSYSGLGTWLTSQPATTTTGIYMTQCLAATKTPTVAVVLTDWTSPVIVAKNGINGTNGTNAIISSSMGLFADRDKTPAVGSWYTITDTTNVVVSASDTDVKRADGSSATGVAVGGKSLYCKDVNVWLILLGDVFAENIIGTTITGKTLQTSSANERFVVSHTDKKAYFYGSGATPKVTIGFGTLTNGYTPVMTIVAAANEDALRITHNSPSSNFMYDAAVVINSGSTGVFVHSTSTSVGKPAIEGYSESTAGQAISGRHMSVSDVSFTSPAGVTGVGNVGVYGGSSGAGNSCFKTFITNGCGGYSPFTGSHEAFIHKAEVFTDGDILVDVRILGRYEVSDTLSQVTVSTNAKAKAVIGIVTTFYGARIGSLDQYPALRSGIVSDIDLDDFLCVTINAVGEGQINVCKDGGNIEAGDYICSSNRRGKGMKQDDDLLHNYTVAKAREACVWSDSEDDIRTIACTYHCG